MDIAEFLTARLDEDEHLAREVERRIGSTRNGEPYGDGSGVAVGDDFPTYPWGLDEAELPFMAGPGRPSRVLADVAAKRTILAWAIDHPRTCGTEHPQFDVHHPGGHGPNEVAALLAQPYAEHPDFDPGWRVQVS